MFSMWQGALWLLKDVIWGILILVSGHLFVSANDWRPLSSKCYNTVEMITTPVPETLMVSTSSGALTVITCSAWCCSKNSDSFVYYEGSSTCECNDGILTGYIVDVSKTSGVFYGEAETMLKISKDGDFKRYAVAPEKQDCLELYEEGYRVDGVYRIRPPGGAAVDAWCDMADGGWTVILRRQDGSEDFQRGWNEFVIGFGNQTGEYWLGLERIHLLTAGSSSLHVYAETFGDVSPPHMYALYDSITVRDNTTNYRLEISGYTGDCGDSMANQNNMEFTTLDRDNDLRQENCAQLFSGAYWHNRCHASNPNGLYLQGAVSTAWYGQGIVWHGCWGHNYSLKVFIMKVKRN